MLKTKRSRKLVKSKQDENTDWGRHIAREDFYSNPQEKTKLNWFLFEYALECESFIRRDKKLRTRLMRKGVSSSAIGSFCIYYSKEMRKKILDRVSGKTSIVKIGYEEIESFFPRIGDELVDYLLSKVAEAWDSQTGVCVNCRIRCISEKEQYAPMFDDPAYS